MKVKKIATGSLGGLFSEWRKMRKWELWSCLWMDLSFVKRFWKVY